MSQRPFLPRAFRSFTRARSRQLLLRGAAALAATALAAVAARSAQDGDAPRSAAPDAEPVRSEVSAVAAVVAKRRGLRLDAAIDVEVLAPDDFRSALRAQLVELHPPGHFEHAAAAFRLLGIVPPTFDGDLLEACLDGLASNVVGLYSPTRGAILVPDRFDHPLSRAIGAEALRSEILAHEVQHALQDRRWPIANAFGRGAANHDARLAANALLEGDAVATGIDFQLSHQDRSFADVGDDVGERVRDQIELTTAIGSIGTGALADPTFQSFSYATGVGLVQRLVAEGGWERVDAALDAPPASTEQVLHPVKYLSEHDWPTTVGLALAPTLERDGWSVVASDTLGELVLRELMATTLDEAALVRASFGWDGDRWLLLRRDADGAAAVVWSSVWDSRVDARDAFEALAEVLELELHADGDRAASSTRRAGSTFLARDGDRVALCVGIDGGEVSDGAGDDASARLERDEAVVELALAAPLVHDERDTREGRGDGRVTRRLEREALAALEKGRVVVDGLTVHVRDIDLIFTLPSDRWEVSTDTPLAAVRVFVSRGTPTVNFNASVAPSEGLDPEATLAATLGFIEDAFGDVKIERSEVVDDPRGPAFALDYSADLGGRRAWFRQLGVRRGERYVVLTCTSVGSRIQGAIADEFTQLLRDSTLGGVAGRATTRR